MTDIDALTAACLDSPADDTPRLILADALQEAGQDARAEFIRTQIALAACGPPHKLANAAYPDIPVPMRAHGDKHYSFGGYTDEGFEVGDRVDVLVHRALKKPIMVRGFRVYKINLRTEAHERGETEVYVRLDAESGPWKGAALKQREHDLLRPVLHDLCESLPGGGWDYFRKDGATNAADLYQNGRVVFQPVAFTRGFLSAVFATIAYHPDQFAHTVASIFAAHPLESVTVGFEGSERRYTVNIVTGMGYNGKPCWRMDWDKATLALNIVQYADDVSVGVIRDTRADLAAAIAGWLTTALREPMAAVWREREQDLEWPSQEEQDEYNARYPDNDNQNDPPPGADVAPDAVDI